MAIQQQRELVDAEEYALILEEEGFEGHEALETATGTTQDGLEAEQEKLAALQRSRTEKVLTFDLTPVCPYVPPHLQLQPVLCSLQVPTAEVAISEEWLQSLRERRRVREAAQGGGRGRDASFPLTNHMHTHTTGVAWAEAS